MPTQLNVRIARAKHVERAAGAASEVEHPPRPPLGASDLPFDVTVRERLVGMISRHGVAEQLFEVATGQPHRWRFQDRLAAGSVLGELAHDRAQETGVVPQVAAPQTARFLREPVRPLEPGALHPRRRLRDKAGVEVERGADPDQHGRLELRAQHRHPLLLLGHADADPHHVGLGLVDLRGDRGLLLDV